MKRSGFVLPVVIVVVALAAIGGVIAWRTTYFDSFLPVAVINFFGRSADSATPQPEPPSENSEPTAGDITKDWKTYTNKKAGISFKYPKEWVAEENEKWTRESFWPVVTIRESGDAVVFSFYTNFGGGFECQEEVETRNVKLATGEEVLLSVLEPTSGPECANDDYDERGSGVVYFPSVEPYGFLSYLFDKSVNPDSLSILETILSTFKLL